MAKSSGNGFQWLKPNSEKPGEPGFQRGFCPILNPPSTAGLLPLRGKPRERGWKNAMPGLQLEWVNAMNEPERNAVEPIDQIKDWPTYFEQIRRRPGMWLGQPSLTALDHQIGGISLAESIYDVPIDKRLGGFAWSEFEKWADERFNPNRLSIRSFSMAHRMTGTESEAFALWFQWYDQFNHEHG